MPRLSALPTAKDTEDNEWGKGLKQAIAKKSKLKHARPEDR